MKIILLKSVEKIGEKNDIKEVKAGFARNFLIPQGLAVLATEKAISEIQAHKKAIQEKLKLEKEKAVKMLKKLDGLILAIFAKAGDKGKLFASFSAKDIIAKLEKKGFKNISENHIKLDQAIKQTGKYNIIIDMGFKKKAEIILNIKSRKK